MTIKLHKLVPAALASAVLLSVFLAAAHVKFPDLSAAEPRWLIAVLGAHLLMVSTRGIALRALMPRPARSGFLRWVHLAARHQLVFSVFPGGVGDAGFPYFAKRIAGLDIHDAVRTIAQFRMRDLIFVALMGLSGLILLGRPNAYAGTLIALAIPVLWFSDDVATAFLRLGMKLVPHSRLIEFLRIATDHERPTTTDRIVRTILAMVIWSASVTAVMAAFRAIGAPIHVAEALVFIAAVNFAGAISLSVAGLGPSEAGAAVALVAAGRSIQRASSLALVVRPLLLLSVVSSSLILEFVMSFLRSRRRLTQASIP
jgi:uncharacterized membrane protein YbhN (UPF0104 family)